MERLIPGTAYSVNVVALYTDAEGDPSPGQGQTREPQTPSHGGQGFFWRVRRGGAVSEEGEVFACAPVNGALAWYRLGSALSAAQAGAWGPVPPSGLGACPHPGPKLGEALPLSALQWVCSPYGHPGNPRARPPGVVRQEAVRAAE